MDGYVLPNDVTLENIKSNPTVVSWLTTGNKSSNQDTKRVESVRYTVRLKVPVDWIDEPRENVAISYVFVNQPVLKDLCMFSQNVFIEDIENDYCFLKNEFSEVFLSEVVRKVKKLPKEASLVL